MVSEMIWTKSQRSMAGDNNCVEVALGTSCTFVRDSKNLSGENLTFTRETWSSFIASVKRGDFVESSPQSS
jgi:hypothetical protein